MDDCATCRFFVPTEVGSGGSGNCRRHAPVAIQHTEIDGLDRMHSSAWTVWPQVGEAQGCGDWDGAAEFEEVEEQPPAPARTYKCDHCHDGDRVPPDEVDFTCPRCGASTMPF